MENEFLNYIKLRHQASITPGNSGDEILDSYYFCNIKREYDKVSRYIRDHICKAVSFRGTFKILSEYDKLRNIFLSRIHNRIETLEYFNIPNVEYRIIEEDIPFKQNPQAYRVQKFLLRLKRETEGWDDSEWCVGNHLHKILSDEILSQHNWLSFEDAINSWASVLRLSPESFLVYQLALDLEWLFDYKDIDTFFIVGPGAVRGVNMIYYSAEKAEEVLRSKGVLTLQIGLCADSVFESIADLAKNDFTGELGDVDYKEEIRRLQKYVNDSSWAKENDIYLHINDIEFNLCEFNKYYSKKRGWKTTLRKYTKRTS